MLRLTKIAFLLTLFLLTGCPSNSGNASVSCQHLEKYQSSFGVLNAPDFALGDLIVLNTGTKKGFRKLGVTFQAGDTSDTDPTDETSIISNADFQVKADANLPAGVVADLTTDVEHNTLFALKNHHRKNLTVPEDVLNKSQAAVAAVQNAQPGEVYFLVSSVILASEASFKLKDATDVQAGVQLKKYGDFKVTVSYGCEGALEVISKQPSGMLFKGDFLKFDPSARKAVIDASQNINLADYDFTLTH